MCIPKASDSVMINKQKPKTIALWITISDTSLTHLSKYSLESKYFTQNQTFSDVLKGNKIETKKEQHNKLVFVNGIKELNYK